MNDLLFVLGVFIFIFFLWLGNGGPMHPLAFTGPILYSNQILLPHSSSKIYRSHSLSSVVENTPKKTTSLKQERQKAAAALLGTPSPYRGIVTMSHYVSGADSSNPSHEYITIHLATNSAPVDITGWKLESGATGAAAIIPKGTEVPRSGIINAAEPIVLTSGSRAIISSGRSPIGASFRENICIGYFAQYQSFYPSLALTCPIPFDEMKKNYNGSYIRDLSCINYVRKINRCSLVTTPPVGLSTACTNFAVNDLNYNGCVTLHQHDKDFEGNTWRVFLGRNKSMWRPRYEVVKLLDAQGKIVDTFSY